MELASAAQRDRAQAVLAGVGCGEPQPDERPDRLTLPAPRDGLELIEEAAAELRRAGIGVSDLGLRRPTLDDVFLQLTGAPPSEDGAGPGDRRAADGRERPAPAWRCRGRTGPAPAAPRDCGCAAVTDAAVVTGRNLRHFIRQPQLLIFSTIQPVMFVLLFVYVFGGAIERLAAARASPTSTSCCPGIFVQSVDLRRHADGGRAGGGPGARGGRPLPVDADGALGGAGRPHRRRPGPQHR